MNPTKYRTLSGKGLPVAVIALMLAVWACAPGTILKWNQVDAANLMNADAGQKKLNVIRFETFGPDAEQLFGYFLYKEGIEVITGEGIPLKRLGKLTVGEVMDDYAQTVKSRQYSSGTHLVVREVLRGEFVVGYTANDLKMDVDIWDLTTNKDAKVVLRLVYKDLRKKDGGDRHWDADRGNW